MQRVIHQYRNRSQIFTLMENLYTFISDWDNQYEGILWLDTSFAQLCDILQCKLFVFNTPKLKEFGFSRIPCPRNDPKEITVCLSGGKDSAATAFYYVSRGYKVHLYHAMGINRAYGDERKAAENIAKYLHTDIFVDKFLLDGTHKFIEHPLKNYIIANGAIHYCLAMGYTPRIAFGNFNKASIDLNEFDVCGGDCIEMWDAYRPIIQKVLPEFDIEIPLETNADTFNILSTDWDLFKMSVSCMSPYRFREHWKHRSEEKYNVRLFENRCGCCWKCCIEWMWLADTDKVDYNEDFYMHCVDILCRTIYKETGHRPSFIQDVWDNYMFYPMTKSKAYKPMKRLKIKKRWT